MSSQLILIVVLAVCSGLFVIQWIRQAYRIAHGQYRPFSKAGIAADWLLIIAAVFSGAGLFLPGVRAEADSPQKVVATRKTHETHETHETQKHTDLAVDAPAPAAQHIKLDQQGHANISYDVPAQTQFQIVEGDNGNVLETIAPQPQVKTVNYTFSKAGNYYLIVTKDQQAKTAVVNVTQ